MTTRSGGRSRSPAGDPCAGAEGPTIRWLERTLDPEGVPRRLPTSEWRACLGSLLRAAGPRGRDWPEAITARVEGLAQAVLRFARPDGSSAFGPDGPEPG